VGGGGRGKREGRHREIWVGSGIKKEVKLIAHTVN